MTFSTTPLPFGVNYFDEMGRQETQAETEVVKHLVELLRSEQYKDVLPSFKNSKLLEHFSFSPVLKKVLSIA